MHPLTDIICLVHNRLSVTKGFVDHLFNNTENFNLIFVNNGSDSETTEYLELGKQDNKWSLLSFPENIGIIRGRNEAASKVTSDYFLNIDNDQYVGTNWLELLHDKMSTGYDIVGREAWIMHKPKSSGVVIVEGKQHRMDYYPQRRCTRANDAFTYIGCGGMLIKHEVYKAIGLFDERYSPAYFEDPDFCFRSMQAGYKIAWEPNCRIDHIGHQTIGAQTLFNKNKQFTLSWNRFIDRWYPYYPEKVNG